MAKYSPKIDVSSNSRFYLVDTKKINEIANRVLTALGLSDYELSVQFVEPQTIRALNRKFRGKDKTTDVLSFPQQGWIKPVIVRRQSTKRVKPIFAETLGDVVISLSDAKRNALDIGHDLDRETAFLLVHGILHLCGHDHMKKNDEELMTMQQRKLMKILANEESVKPLWKNCVTKKRLRI